MTMIMKNQRFRRLRAGQAPQGIETTVPHFHLEFRNLKRLVVLSAVGGKWFLRFCPAAALLG